MEEVDRIFELFQNVPHMHQHEIEIIKRATSKFNSSSFRDQKCNGHCLNPSGGPFSDLDSFPAASDESAFVDCGFEGGDRNICADRISSCDKWMERRYGKRII